VSDQGKTALLVGGTAATGVAIAAELRARGFAVTIYHRGEHEIAELDDLEHIHGDPHDARAIEADLAGRRWDVTVATYGRIRYLCEALRGRTGQFVSVSGLPVASIQAGVPITEDHPTVRPEQTPRGLTRLLPRIVETEQAVIAAHHAGDFVGTVVRYPYVYGPYSVMPMEWHVIRRALDRRKTWILQGAGLALSGRCAAPNAARVVALALDQPAVAGGSIYHAADTRQYTQREWIELVAGALDYTFDFVDIPAAVCALGNSAVPMAGEYTWVRSDDVAAGRQRHALVANEKARRELGYVDVVEPAAWIRRTVEYWLQSPPIVDGRNGRLQALDFDYAAEDALLTYWRGVQANAPRVGEPFMREHPYAHPKVNPPQPGS
jgi:nucleoside-diphosphate-sugar epimerase